MKPPVQDVLHPFPFSQKQAWLLLVLLLLFICWCANPGQLYFFNDDFIDIPLYSDGRLGGANSIRYVNDFSLYLDHSLYGKNATGYHFTNLLLYLADVLLAIPVLKKIAASLYHPIGNTTAILIVSLFSIYAFHSEALFWILCRTATLSFLFTLLCWLCVFKGLNRRFWLLPMAVFFVLGLFTYESVWVFPCWLLLWYFLLHGGDEQRKKLRLPIGIIWLLFIVYLPLRHRLSGEVLGTYEASDVQQLNLLSMAGKAARLFARTFLPPVQNPVWFAAFSALVLLALALAGIILWKSKKGNRLLLFFLAAWLLSYFPYVSLGISTSGYESERYLYFPSFFCTAFFVYALILFFRNKPVQGKLLLTALFVYQLLFFYQVAEAFKVNSRFSRTSITAFQQTNAQKKLVIKNLPEYNHGLPVFHYGFYNALAWLAPGRDSMNTQIMERIKFNSRLFSIRANTTNPAADTLTFTPGL